MGDGEEWKEIGAKTLRGLERPYRPSQSLLFRFDVERDYYYRWDRMREFVAGFLNDTRRTRRGPGNGSTLDIWFGQANVGGRHLPQMHVCVATRATLPARSVFRSLRKRSTFMECRGGAQPVALALFPELRVIRGEVFRLKLAVDLSLTLSATYKRIHSLEAWTRDPYLQMASQATEPVDFALCSTGPSLGAAIEEVRSVNLRAEDLPAVDAGDAAWRRIERFAHTYNALAAHDSLSKAYDVGERVFDVLKERGDAASLKIDELRAALFLEVLKVQFEKRAPNDEELAYALTLLAKIRDALERKRLPKLKLKPLTKLPVGKVERH